MKRTSIVLLSILLISVTFLTGCAKAASANTIKVATDATFKPFEYMDDKGNMVGIDIDLMNQIADKAGLKIDWVNQPFDSALAGLSECQYDAMIAAVSITDERKQAMLFSDPYMTAGLVVVVAKNNTTINGLSDLNGKTVAAQLGTTGEQTAQKIPNVNYKPYDSYELAFLDLANGQIDAVIADSPVAAGYVKANADKIKEAGDVFDAADYGIAICKSNTALQTKINAALKQLIDAGVIDDLAKKYNP